MNHGEASGKLLELAYGELPPREAREVDAHAAGCAACRDELAGIRETRALMAQLPVEAPPGRGEGIVMAAARAMAEARKPRPLLPRWAWAGGAGAMAAAAVAVVSWQLAKAPHVGSLRDGGSELLVGAPPSVAAPTAERAEETRAAPSPAMPALKREEACERMGEAASAGGDGAGVRGGVIARGGERAKRARPMSAPPSAPPEPSTSWKAAPAEAEQVADSYAPPPPAAAPMAAAPMAAPPPMGAQKVRALAAPERKSAAAGAAQAPRAEAAPGAVESRVFADCPGERRRVVERDGEGRVVRYVRVGDRRTVEQRYGADGRLRSAFATEDGGRRELPPDAPGLVREARDAGIDAPPRCEP
jgi:hypothetical protein